jgi:hypothetical protein
VRPRVLVALVACVLGAARVQAQTPLPTPIICHGCPDRATYRFVEDIPFDSLQSHWSARGANLYGDFPDVLGFNPKGTVLDAAHAHLQCGSKHLAPAGTTNYARYGEYSGPMHFDCEVVIRDLKGYVFLWDATHFKSSNAQRWYHVVWDDTGTAAQPLMIGNPAAPMGVQTFKFHFDMDPRENFHGWDQVDVGLHAHFDNGDEFDADHLFPYWNNVDPTAPITMMSQGLADKPVWGVLTAPFVNPALHSGDTFGQNIVMVENYLPTAPLAGAWTLPPTPNEASTTNPITRDAQGHGPTFASGPVAFTNSYGQTVPSTDGSCQVRRNQNFHMEDLSQLGPDGLPTMKGIYGTETSRVDQSQTIACQLVIDNTGLPPGDVTYAIERFQPENNIATNAVGSLIVIHVPVPDGSTPIDVPPPSPPPTCVPPAVLTNGQCVTPPPPPPPAPIPTLTTIQMCAIETFSDGSVKNRCLDLP